MTKLDPATLRKNDIRGTIGKTLFPQNFYDLGRAFVTFLSQAGLSQPTIAVAYDGRLTSPKLFDSLCRGLQDAGASLLDLGLNPTPVLYFAAHHLNTTGAVIVTGSHNPKEDNGLKLMIGTRVLSDREIQTLGQIIEDNQLAKGQGSLQKVNIQSDYIHTVLQSYLHPAPLRVAWDNGNGAAGHVLQALVYRLPGYHTLLFADVNGDFPNHHPDPTVMENLLTLQSTVVEGGYDVGFAFDGDADRLGVIDASGRLIWGDQLLLLFSQFLLKDHPGATIIGDVKASSTLFEGIEAMGGIPLMWKSGHSFIKAKMRETNALLAGEMSGHLFFADQYYGFDDALYAAIRVLDLLGRTNVPLHQLIDQFPTPYSTPELRIPCEETEKEQIVQNVRTSLYAQGIHLDETDGLRVQRENGWWLLRYSNTQAALVARCEANSEENLKVILKELTDHLDQHDLKLAS